ncbi:amidohydrolase family protein [Shimia sp. W99]
MSDIEIVNCHIHTFTAAHVPRNFPFPLARLFRKSPHLVRALAGLARMLGQHPTADTLDRLYRFVEESGHKHQRELLELVKRHYPSNTRFVVLPMDMEGVGFGKPQAGLKAQHDELAALARHPEHEGTVIPFATVNPVHEGSVAEGLRAIRELGFEGLKIYPRLGFAPDHPDLMQDVYPEMQARGLPVMTHCSRGGAQGRHVCDYKADQVTRPYAYKEVLRAFPDMRLCLAHFGGQKDWRAYANGEELPAKENWQRQIRQMIGSGEWPNLWTDISYTLFHFDDYIPFLRLFLLDESDAGERLRRRVLFGSDYYMTRQESLSEKAVCFRLRNALGEEVFRQIAEKNPVEWLTGRPA